MVNPRPHLGGGGAPGGFISWNPHRLKWRDDFFCIAAFFTFLQIFPKFQDSMTFEVSFTSMTYDLYLYDLY